MNAILAIIALVFFTIPGLLLLGLSYASALAWVWHNLDWLWFPAVLAAVWACDKR